MMTEYSLENRPGVLVICNIFSPSATTGIEILRVELTRRYRAVRPIVLTGDYDDYSKARTVPLEMYRVPMMGGGPLGRIRSALLHRYANVMIDRAISLLPAVRKMCREHDIRLIECGNSNLGFVGYLAHRWLGVPYAMWVNSSEDPVVTGNYGRFSGSVSRLALAHAVAIITPSYSTQRHVQCHVSNPEKVHAVQMGVDTSRFSPGPPTLPDDLTRVLANRTVLLSVSRLVTRKGIDTVIKALPSISQTVADVLYVVVGEGPDRSRLESMATELGVGDRVLFTGERAGDELVSLYRACQLFLLVSRFEEGLGMAALEAAACGKPVVVGDQGGQPETVEHGVTGYCVPAESIRAVERACVDILSNPALARSMGRAGGNLAATMSWDRAAEVVEQLMVGIIKQGVVQHEKMESNAPSA